MSDWIREILNQHGQSVTLGAGEDAIAAKAFLQPMTGRNEQVPGDMCGIGALDERLWLYLGQTEVRPGDNLCWNGLVFRVCSSREYHLGEESLYWWASLEQEREEAE